MPAENVGAVAGAQSCQQRVPDFRRCDREATYHPNEEIGVGTGAKSTRDFRGQLFEDICMMVYNSACLAAGCLLAV